MKKMISVLLFVTIVSNNLFSQDGHVKSFAYGLAYNDKISNKFILKSKFTENTEIDILKNQINISDMFHTCLEVYDRDSSEYQGKKSETLYCKDNEGNYCLFFLDKDFNNNPYYLICYDDIAYFYYIKNN